MRNNKSTQNGISIGRAEEPSEWQRAFVLEVVPDLCSSIR